ncbi:MAG TPA: S46 family peptidase [Pyrinomonadaceae bacterium]
MRLKAKFLTSFILTTAVLLSSFSFVAAFDEGMYTPDQIAKLPLRQRGLKINPNELYNPNGVDISDAVIRLSIGCTAEFVSPKGLILTNHHCGFDALVSASTPQTDYVENGFKADSMAQEMPAKDYSIFITNRVEDVTARIARGTENLTGDAFSAAIKKNIEELTASEQAKAPKGAAIRVQALNSGYYYYLYETQQIQDVRVVYAPPRNIGVFGGDPDNFEWTRHTGDFTFLRAYVAPDGSSAPYSTSNVPYAPKKHLTVNLGGVKENDFVFVMGYPGSTTRYRESQAIDFAEKVNFPFLAAYLKARSDALRKVGETDEQKRIRYQSDIANLDNYRKVYGGSSLAVRRGETVAARRAEETKFATWVNADAARRAKYGEVLPSLSRVSGEYYTTSQRDLLVRTLPPAALVTFRQLYDAFASVLSGKKMTDAEEKQKLADVQKAWAAREPIFEREIIKFFLEQMAELPADQKFAAAESLFGSQTGRQRRAAEEAFAVSIAENNDFDTPEEIVDLYDKSANDLRKDYPNLFAFMSAFIQEKQAVATRTGKFGSEIDRLRRLYLEGMAEMKGVRPYPDANSTLRFTYGNIKGYAPREAVRYTPFTTIKGMIEKDTGVNPFDVPEKLKELQRNRDFGRYGQGDSVVVNFLASTDIIGGNSGSPVLNAYGEQVGLVFDGNYEGLGNDIFYSADYGRTIAVDIRYVLFVTEKFGDAKWVVDEMTIKGGASRAVAAR